MTPRFIDTHAHVNFRDFKDDSEEVLRESLNAGVWVVNVGSQYETSRRAVALAEKFEKGIYAVVGLHPLHLFSQIVDVEEESFISREEQFDYQKYRELASHPKVVGIGECGLEYYHLPPGREEEIKAEQLETFLGQLNLASELDKVLMVHSRDAYEAIYQVIKRHRGRLREVVIHSFIGNWEQAKKFLDIGCHIGFNGIITYKPRKEKKPGGSDPKLLEAVGKVALDRILLETDCPYLAPVPYRGKRSEPVYVKFVAEKIAEIKELSIEEVELVTTANARKLFRI